MRNDLLEKIEPLRRPPKVPIQRFLLAYFNMEKLRCYWEERISMEINQSSLPYIAPGDSLTVGVGASFLARICWALYNINRIFTQYLKVDKKNYYLEIVFTRMILVIRRLRIHSSIGLSKRIL